MWAKCGHGDRVMVVAVPKTCSDLGAPERIRTPDQPGRNQFEHCCDLGVCGPDLRKLRRGGVRMGANVQQMWAKCGHRVSYACSTVSPCSGLKTPPLTAPTATCSDRAASSSDGKHPPTGPSNKVPALTNVASAARSRDGPLQAGGNDDRTVNVVHT